MIVILSFLTHKWFMMTVFMVIYIFIFDLHYTLLLLSLLFFFFKRTFVLLTCFLQHHAYLNLVSTFLVSVWYFLLHPSSFMFLPNFFVLASISQWSFILCVCQVCFLESAGSFCRVKMVSKSSFPLFHDQDSSVAYGAGFPTPQNSCLTSWMLASSKPAFLCSLPCWDKQTMADSCPAGFHVSLCQ